jgi:hypothetical protein
METTTRRPLLVIALIALVIGSLAALPLSSRVAGQEEAQETGSLRFLHAYSGGGPVDVYVDGEQLVTQLAFGTATEYATVPTGDRQIQVVATGEDVGSALIDTTVSVDAGQSYNVIIGGQNDELDARSYDVNTDQVGTGQARVRFIPGAPDTGAADLRLGPDAAAGTEQSQDNNDNLPDFSMAGIGDDGTGAMDYQEVPAGVYGIYASEAGSGDPRVNVASIELQEGMVYDVVVLGQLENNNLTFIPLMTTIAAPCSTALGVGQAEDACFRIVHTSADAGEVDVYVDDAPIAQAISYGTATEFAAVGNGEHQVRVVAAGGAVDDAWLDETITFDQGRAYQLTIAGIAEEDDNGDNDLRLLHDEIDLSPVADGEARVRFTHAVSDVGDVDIAGGAGAGTYTGVGFGDVTDSTNLTAGSYDYLITDNDNATVLDAKGVQIEAGNVYDLLVIGLSSQSSVELLVLTTPVTVLKGAQGTPIAVQQPGAQTSQPSPVGAANATVVGGEQVDSTPVGAAPVTPVITPENTPTPTS